MKRILLAAIIAASATTLAASAQKRTPFDGRIDYQLTVSKESPASIGAWWPAFIEQNTLEGYCWNLNTLPLADRPQLGHRAKILRVGGAGAGRTALASALQHGHRPASVSGDRAERGVRREKVRSKKYESRKYG